jgi:adenosine deaminase
MYHAPPMNLLEFSRRMPKVELHVHLEGSIRPATLLRLAERNGVTLPAQDIAGLSEFYRFRDFAHFVEVYVAITRCLCSPEDYTLVAYEFGSDLARQNIRYAEATFTIATNVRMTGLPSQIILEALNSGRGAARRDYGVEWRWILDISRDTPDTQDTVLEMALAGRDQGVVALGLGGTESRFPPELFARTFTRARDCGLARVPHAGETAGPDSVWTALRSLHANRIGHGVRSVEDEALVTYLCDHQVVLEICPTSNISLGVYPDYEHHPLRTLYDAGVSLTVNSDDPPMFGTDLLQEYALLVEKFGFDADDLERVSLNAVRAGLLPAPDKARLAREFRTEFDRLRGFSDAQRIGPRAE